MRAARPPQVQHLRAGGGGLAPHWPGYPPTMNLDASLGFSRTGHGSAEVAFGSRDADGCVSVRPVGTASRAHSGSRCELGQGAEMGYCPSCASATRVALPPSCALGDNSDVRAERVVLRQECGPEAPRRFAALHYAGASGSLPQGRYWEAGSHTMDFPDPRLRAPLREDVPSLYDSRSKPSPRQTSVDKTTGFVSLRGDTRTRALPVAATPAMDFLYMPEDKGAPPSEIGDERSVGPTRIERFPALKNSSGGYRWEGPPSPKTGPAMTDLDTTAHYRTKRGKIRILPISGTKRCSPAEGEKDAPLPGHRGGYREGPPFISSGFAAPIPGAIRIPRIQKRYLHHGGAIGGRENNSAFPFFFAGRPPLVENFSSRAPSEFECDINKN